MTLYLLRQYAKPGMILAENRGLLALSMLAPTVLISGWLFPEFAFWFAAAQSLTTIPLSPQRPTAFEASLPLAGRDVALARLITSVIPGLLALFLLAALIMARSPEKFSLMRALQSVLFVMLCSILVRLVRVRELAVSAADTLYPLLSVTALSAAAIVYLPGWVVLGLLFGVLLGAGAVWWRTIPAAYQIAPLAVDTRRVRSTSSSGSGKYWWRILWSSMFTKQRLFISLMLIFGGATGQWPIFALNCLSVEDLWQRSRWMMPFPLSHRFRLWMILAPAAILPLMMALIGMQIHFPGNDYLHAMSANAPDTYQRGERYYDSPTRVSLTYWAKVQNGSVPRITAPWGESVEPFQVKAFGSVYYNVYSVRESNSAQFTAWQFERLTTAVYGFPILQKDYDPANVKFRSATESPRMMILSIALTLSGIFLYLVISWIPKVRSVWKFTKFSTPFMWIVVVAPAVGFLYVTMFLNIGQRANAVVIPLLQTQLLRLSAALPQNIFALLALSSIPVLASYALLEWQFARSETTGVIIPVK